LKLGGTLEEKRFVPPPKTRLPSLPTGGGVYFFGFYSNKQTNKKSRGWSRKTLGLVDQQQFWKVPAHQQHPLSTTQCKDAAAVVEEDVD